MEESTAVSPAPEPAGTTAGLHGRVSRNLIAAAFSFTLSIVIGLWYTPFVIRNLGVESYGVIPLVSSITGYLSIITVSLSGLVGRDITLDLARGDKRSANSHFSTYLVTSTAVASGLFVIALAFSFVLPFFLRVPPGQEGSSRLLFLAIAGAFLMSTVSSTFESAFWATNRFDLRNLIESLTMILRTALVVALFAVTRPALWQVAAAVTVAAIFSLSVSARAFRRLLPDLRFQRAHFEFGRVINLWKTSRWLILNQAGTLLSINLDLVLINLLLGPLAGGLYAPVLQFATLLRAGLMTIGFVVGPPSVIMYGRSDWDTLLKLTRQSTMFLMLAAAIPVSLLCGFSRPLLETWLGPRFEPLNPLAWFILLPLCIEAGQIHYMAIFLAADKVRAWAMCTVLSGVATIGLAILLTGKLGFGMYGVAFSVGVVSILRNGVFASNYMTRLVGLSWWKVYGEIAAKVLLHVVFFSAFALLVAQLLHGRSWIRLAAAVIPTGLVITLYAFRFVLGHEERDTIQKMIRSRLGSSVAS